MPGNGRRAALHNLGCKVNAYETEAMRQLLEKAGYTIVPFEEEADVYVINTCSVTGIADRKSRQMLSRARKRNPKAVVVAAGCYVQTALERTHLPVDADLLIGTANKGRLTALLDEWFEAEESARRQILAVTDVSGGCAYDRVFIDRTPERTRADIKIQDGCNQFCSYCMIPYARGRVRSRGMDDILSEIGLLASQGVKEFVLTGIHLSSYGTDLHDGAYMLGEVIREVAKIDGVQRIRLGSLEPGIITDAFARELEGCGAFCPHFHLSLQSGSNTVLRRMNRHYTAEEYYEKVCLLRSVFEKPAITTDVIAGFPGETQEEFETTRAFLQKVNFYETHVFRYSVREGTRAARMEGQVPESVKAARSEILIADDRERRRAFEKSCDSLAEEVLFEEREEADGGVWFTGHTRRYIRAFARAEGTEDLSGTIRKGILSASPCPGEGMLFVPGD